MLLMEHVGIIGPILFLLTLVRIDWMLKHWDIFVSSSYIIKYLPPPSTTISISYRALQGPVIIQWINNRKFWFVVEGNCEVLIAPRAFEYLLES